MAAAGFCGWNALAATLKSNHWLRRHAASVPAFAAGKGPLVLRLPDVKPPCILAPGASPGAIFSPRNEIHCSSIAGPTRWFASRAASSVTTYSRCAHAPGPAVVGTLSISRQSPVQHGGRGGRRRPPEDRRRWPHSIRPAPPQGHAGATGASRSSFGSPSPAMWSNMSSSIRWPSAHNAPRSASIETRHGGSKLRRSAARISAAPATAAITMASADQGRAAGRAGGSGRGPGGRVTAKPMMSS